MDTHLRRSSSRQSLLGEGLRTKRRQCIQGTTRGKDRHFRWGKLYLSYGIARSYLRETPEGDR